MCARGPLTCGAAPEEWGAGCAVAGRTGEAQADLRARLQLTAPLLALPPSFLQRRQGNLSTRPDARLAVQVRGRDAAAVLAGQDPLSAGWARAGGCAGREPCQGSRLL